MSTTRRSFLAATGVALGALGLAACTPQQQDDQQPADTSTDSSEQQVDPSEFKDLELNDSSWQYDTDNDCYYQLGLKYCLKPASEKYESLAIFVPGAYFDAEKSGDAYKCTPKKDGVVGSLNPASAPAVMPINSVRLSAQACPEAYGYAGLERYLSAGMVYVYAGFRGRSAGIESGSKEMYPGGAPWPVVDLKAAVRYLRYNAGKLPFNPDRIISFGYGMGGGASAALGALGDSDLYAKYLTAIGAATHDAESNTLSDRVYGSATWCPLTSFDTQDAAYEWMMGQFASTDTRADGTWTKLLSTHLAAAYGDYVNTMDLRGDGGEALTLNAVNDGTYLDGSYYEYVLSVITNAASDFFNSTSFPYTYTPSQLGDPCFPGDPNLVADSAEAADAATTEEGTTSSNQGSQQGEGSSSSQPQEQNGVSSVNSTVYDSIDSYLNSLNSGNRWITYSSGRGAARISSLWDFVTHCRPASRSVCAFDMIDLSSSINQLFGIGEESTLHFDQTVSDLLKDHQDEYAKIVGFDKALPDAWEADLQKIDAEEASMADRVSAMNPLYTLSGHYDGYGKAAVAPYWRINSGLAQTNAAICGELNLALALKQYDGVQSVAYQPVWGCGFELAERSGDAQDNLVAWILSCCPQVENAGADESADQSDEDSDGSAS